MRKPLRTIPLHSEPWDYGLFRSRGRECSDDFFSQSFQWVLRTCMWGKTLEQLQACSSRRDTFSWTGAGALRWLHLKHWAAIESFPGVCGIYNFLFIFTTFMTFPPAPAVDSPVPGCIHKYFCSRDLEYLWLFFAWAWRNLNLSLRFQKLYKIYLIAANKCYYYSGSLSEVFA